MKIEIRSKKGLSKARHFVVKLPGPMADSSKTGTPAFCSESIGLKY